MDAFVAVDELRDVQIGGDAREHVGVDDAPPKDFDIHCDSSAVYKYVFAGAAARGKAVVAYYAIVHFSTDEHALPCRALVRRSTLRVDFA